MQIRSFFVFALAALANGNPIVQSSVREAGSLSHMARNLPRGWPSWGSGYDDAKALYFMTNTATNAIVAIPIGQDGFPDVSAKTTTATGGMGGNTVSTTNGSKNGPDALNSQGSLQVAGDVSSHPRLRVTVHRNPRLLTFPSSPSSSWPSMQAQAPCRCSRSHKRTH